MASSNSLQYERVGRRFRVRDGGAVILDREIPPTTHIIESQLVWEYYAERELPNVEDWLLAARDQLDAELEDLPGITAAELIERVPEATAWRVNGLLADGWVASLSARERAGKGKWITLCVVAPLERGEAGPMGGEPTGEPITTLIFSEENLDSMREKLAEAGIRDARVIFHHELAHLDSWEAKVKFLARAAAIEGHGLVWVENLSRASGVEDESGVELGRAVEAFIAGVKAAGMMGLIDHHHKKGQASLENKSRGGTALIGAVDVHLDMEREGERGSFSRHLLARGKHSAACWERWFELSEDRTRYTAIAQPPSREEKREAKVTADLWLVQNALGEAESFSVRDFARAKNPALTDDDLERGSKLYQQAARAVTALVREGDVEKLNEKGPNAAALYRCCYQDAN